MSFDLGNGIRIHLIDFVVFVSLFFAGSRFLKIFLSTSPLLLGNLLWFSNGMASLNGTLYLLRIISFLTFSFVVRDLVFIKKKYKKIFPKVLIFESLVVGFLGFLQYLYLPNFKSFQIWGWDDHLYRLIGTFLDPGFTGIILCLGFILSFLFWLKTKNKKYLLISIFLIISLAFTYSRASMIALVASIFLIAFIKKRFKILFLVILFGLVVYMLPRPASEGVELERVASIFSRFDNYKETFEIFKRNPLFGVGFNNLCHARIKYFQNNLITSHSCSGSDSSILLILSTFGIVGSLILLKFLADFFRRIDIVKFNSQTILVSLFALFLHSQFTNSLIYPWVLGWFCFLFGSLWIERD